VTVFNQSIDRLNNNNTDVSVTSGTFSATNPIQISTTTVTNDTLTVSFTNSSVANGVPFRISYPGIAAACNHAFTGSALQKCWRILPGDYDNNGKVQTNDVNSTAGKIGLTLGSNNFKGDYDANGAFQTNDVNGVAGKIPNSCATCP